MSDERPLVGIFGGSFNPPHLGHMRLAVEVLEAVRPQRLELLPCAVPPHKEGQGLLPFALRFSMLRDLAQGIPGLTVNPMESERDGPSYTYDTLGIYKERAPEARHFFILGAEDFAIIDTWHAWKKLPERADIVIVPRAGMGAEVFMETVRRCWPEAVSIPPPFAQADTAYQVPGHEGQGRLVHLPLPRLDIRSALVRERWLEGRNVRFLVPEVVEKILVYEEKTIRCCWK